MKKYEYETIVPKGILDNVFRDHRRIINEYAQKGYRYVGFLPTKTTGTGGILELELIFEIDE